MRFAIFSSILFLILYGLDLLLLTTLNPVMADFDWP